MLEKILDWLHIATDASIERRRQNSKLDELRDYSRKNSLGFYPVFVTNPPVIANEVGKYIEAKAKKDLPPEQFRETLEVGTIDEWANVMKDWVEIGGILGYDKGIYEITYCPPNPERMSLKLNETGGAEFRTSTSKPFLAHEFERAKMVVDWHTHPGEGEGDLSEGDVKHINDIMERFGHKDIFFVVYMPSNNKTYWYKAKSFSKRIINFLR